MRSMVENRTPWHIREFFPEGNTLRRKYQFSNHKFLKYQFSNHVNLLHLFDIFIKIKTFFQKLLNFPII